MRRWEDNRATYETPRERLEGCFRSFGSTRRFLHVNETLWSLDRVLGWLYHRKYPGQEFVWLSLSHMPH